jgi:chromosome segregation protein
VVLELENKKDPFSAGLNILVKISRGKYFDIASLSGGEKTMVALSLIFAIQEFRPYCFYVFDEIDAALDKHNSELLAALIKKYMTTGQYIIITHNDTLISEATNIYGVSMQENLSKIISLKL